MVGTLAIAALGCRAPASTTPAPAPVFETVIGTWGWTEGDLNCRTNPHAISFSPDWKVMYLRYLAAVDTTGRLEARYEIRGHAPTSIRAFLLDETRRDSTGRLVEWDLVLLTADRYAWHRSDWPAGGTTVPLERCSP